MPEAKITRREWKVNIRLADDGTQTILKQYTKATHYRPDQIDVFIADTGEGPSITKVTLYGPRVLKDGAKGDRANETFYFNERLPSWIIAHADYALWTVGGEILDIQDY